MTFSTQKCKISYVHLVIINIPCNPTFFHFLRASFSNRSLKCVVHHIVHCNCSQCKHLNITSTHLFKQEIIILYGRSSAMLWVQTGIEHKVDERHDYDLPFAPRHGAFDELPSFLCTCIPPSSADDARHLIGPDVQCVAFHTANTLLHQMRWMHSQDPLWLTPTWCWLLLCGWAAHPVQHMQNYSHLWVHLGDSPHYWS